MNITNVSNHAASFIVDIRYPGGHYFIPTKTLPVGGSATFDLRKIINAQTPDNRGTVIPSATIGGQFHWSVFGGAMDSRLIGRSEVVSLFKRLSSSYSCPACCPDSGTYGDFVCPGDTIPVDGYADVTTTGYTVDCNGWRTDMGSLGLESIWMDDPSIGSVSPAYGGSTGIEGLQAGSTNLEGSWHSRDWVSDGWSLCFGSENENTISCEIFVGPEIASISPDHGPVGTTVGVSIFGAGFSETGTNSISVSGSGITATDINFINSGLLSANFVIASDAAAGNHTVRVMTNGFIGNGVPFFVQVPTSLQVLSVSTIPLSPVHSWQNCFAGQDFGLEIATQYQVLDQASPAQAISGSQMLPFEVFTNLVLNGVPGSNTSGNVGPSGYPGSNLMTDGDGRFIDAPFGGCQSGNVTFTFTQTLHILVSQSDYTVRVNNISLSSSSSGHGSITNSSDISASR